MQQPATLVVSSQLQAAVDGLKERLGKLDVIADTRWVSFAATVGLAGGPDEADATVVVGPIAAVLRHAKSTTNEFGFVMPVAQIAKWWQREPAWRDQATLQLWDIGWSPAAVDRVLLPAGNVTIEFAIGNVRPIPEVQSPSARAV